jgi:hypothetical protein
VTRAVSGIGRASALRNIAFASLSTRNAATRALASATYHGRFAGKDWHYPSGGWYWCHHRHPFIVIGWFGPLFWPFAYWDFVDYTVWPYAYDVFWPYAYDDIYWGLYGPYAYPDPVYADAPSEPNAPSASSGTFSTARRPKGERAGRLFLDTTVRSATKRNRRPIHRIIAPKHERRFAPLLYLCRAPNTLPVAGFT